MTGITRAWHHYYIYRMVYLSMRNSTTSLWLNAAAMCRGVAISSFNASIRAWCWTKSFTHLNKSKNQKIRNSKIRKSHRTDCGDNHIIFLYLLKWWRSACSNWLKNWGDFCIDRKTNSIVMSYVSLRRQKLEIILVYKNYNDWLDCWNEMKIKW